MTVKDLPTIPNNEQIRGTIIDERNDVEMKGLMHQLSVKKEQDVLSHEQQPASPELYEEGNSHQESPKQEANEDLAEDM